MSGRLEIAIDPGTAIGAAAILAQRVSNLLGLDVQFDFNGVKCLAVPSGNPVFLAERQCAEQARKLRDPYDVKFASSGDRK